MLPGRRVSAQVSVVEEIDLMALDQSAEIIISQETSKAVPKLAFLQLQSK